MINKKGVYCYCPKGHHWNVYNSDEQNLHTCIHHTYQSCANMLNGMQHYQGYPNNMPYEINSQGRMNYSNYLVEIIWLYKRTRNTLFIDFLVQLSWQKRVCHVTAQLPNETIVIGKVFPEQTHVEHNKPEFSDSHSDCCYIILVDNYILLWIIIDSTRHTI